MIPATSAAASSGAVPYLWVAVGLNAAFTDSRIYTSSSTDGTAWTSQTTSFGTTGINAVAANGLGLFVAVGDAGKLATSNNGADWTQRTSTFGTTNITAVAYGEGLWVAVGTDKCATSTDGITWTARTITTGAWTSLAYGGGSWIAFANNGTASRADDPTGTWTAVNAASTTLSVCSDVLYAYDQAIWVAGNDTGTTGALASTTTASLGTWTARNAPTTVGSGTTWFTQNSSVIVATYTASGANNFLSSTNGTTWTARTAAWTDYTQAVACDSSGLLLAMSYTTNKVQTSSDGTTWTNRTTSGLAMTANAICHSSGMRSILS